MLELVFSGHQEARESEADGDGTFEPLQRRHRNGLPEPLEVPTTPEAKLKNKELSRSGKC